MREEIEKIGCIMDSLEEEKELTRWMLYTFFDYERRKRIYRVNREGIEKMLKRLNEMFDKYMKTKYTVVTNILDKDEDDIAWCRARIDRQVNFQLVKK